ncbi:phage holin family protein [Aeromonas finlandensis]|uniref:phage holin family protein n=1 Tax=Aeromonas finlandensis TaxID=1543375 RepID=UPI00051B952A|nr:phage holin family protein [Aeromonas finlandensis]
MCNTNNDPIAEPALKSEEMESITHLVGSITGLFREQFQEQMELFTLEIQCFSSNLIGMLVCHLVGAFLFMSLWLTLVFSSLFWLLEHEITTSTALFIITFLNGLAIFGVVIRYKHHKSNIFNNTISTTANSEYESSDKPSTEPKTSL